MDRRVDSAFGRRSCGSWRSCRSPWVWRVVGLMLCICGGQATGQDGVGGATQEDGALPPGVYARVDGREITEAEYARFLVASLGKTHLDTFIDRLLLDTDARRQGVVVTPEEVEALVDERLERTIQGVYRGDREAFAAALNRRHLTIEDRRQRDRQEIYYERLLEKLVLKAREVTPEALQEEFERSYGPGGVQYEVRHILVSTRRRTGPGGESLPARTEAEALERANKIRQELAEGVSFVQLVKRFSDDSFTRPNDGRIPLYRAEFYGPEFHAAVEGLSTDSPLSGVVQTRRGFHLIELLDRKVARLEEVRPEVEELVRNRPPTAEERRLFIERLRAAAEIVR